MDLPSIHALARATVASAAALIVLGGGSPLAAPPVALASSVTYTVNRTADTPDADLGASACRDAHGRCSLRAAIMQANYHAGADTIVVPKGTYKLTRKGRNDSAAVVGDLDITDSVTVEGAGATATIVDGNGAVTGDRVFEILAPAHSVTIKGLTIRGGRRTVDSFDSGGGLLWDGDGGSLTLSNVTVRANVAAYGGGLDLVLGGNGAKLSIAHALIAGNKATTTGGGLVADIGSNALLFSVAASRITGNAAYEGGGGYVQGTAALATVQRFSATEIDSNTATLSAGLETHTGSPGVPLTIRDSWIHGNNAAVYGGGIGNYAVLETQSSTVSGNSAASRGGGLYLYTGSLAHLTNVTVSGNTTAGSGGAMYLEKFVSSAAGATAVDTTFASNVATTGGVIAGDAGTTFGTWNVLMAKGAVGDNCALPVTVVQPTYADDASCGLGPGDNASIRLSSLGMHGGKTPTRVPLAGSAGIDGGAALVDPLADQRGIARPQGAGTDAGAVEVCQVAPAAPVLSKPSNGARTTLRRVTLAWKAVPCVEGYKVVVRRKSPTGKVVQTVTLTPSTTLRTVTLARGRTYYWRIKAVGDRGNANSVWRHVHVR